MISNKSHYCSTFVRHVRLNTARLLSQFIDVSKLLKPHSWFPFSASFHSETALTDCSGLLRLTRSLRRLRHQTTDLRTVLQPHGERPEDAGWVNSNARGHQGESGGKGLHSQPPTLDTNTPTRPTNSQACSQLSFYNRITQIDFNKCIHVTLAHLL